MSSYSKWLQAELDSRGWKQADLARKSNLDTAVISNLIRNKRNPGEVTSRAIAHAFGYPPEIVFRAAGLLSEVQGETAELELWRHMLGQLSKHDREILLRFAMALVELQERDNDKKG